MRARVVTLTIAILSFAPFAVAQTQPPAPAIGSAVVRGRIVAGDTGKPLRRSRVSFAAPQLGGRPLSVNTGVDGRYEIRDLPAGQYTVSAERSGFMTLRYGQRRPLEAPRLLKVLDGQTIERIDFALPKTASISGHVMDEVGDSVAGATVFALRSQYWLGRRQLVPAGVPVRTDDTGQFRLPNLAPGNYFVRAMTRDTWTMTRAGRKDVMSFLSSYYPGTADATAAQPIAVGAGEQMRNMDFALTPGRTVTLSGTAVDSHGRPLMTVAVGQEVIGPSGGSVGTAGNSPVAADGTFRIRDVTPGEYRLMAVGSGEIALLPIVVRADIENIALVASAGWSASGSIVTDTGAPPSIPRGRVRLNMSTSAAYRMHMQGEPELRPVINDDWTFSISGIVGAARLLVNVPDGWMVKSVLQNGRDISEASLEMKTGETLSDVQVIVTNRVTGISGQLINSQGAPVDGTVIAFSSNAEKWVQDSRVVRAVRPTDDGGFQIIELPAGEYFIIAVDYVQDGMWNDPEYLESIRRDAQRVMVGDGNTPAVSLRLVTR